MLAARVDPCLYVICSRFSSRKGSPPRPPLLRTFLSFISFSFCFFLDRLCRPFYFKSFLGVVAARREPCQHVARSLLLHRKGSRLLLYPQNSSRTLLHFSISSWIGSAVHSIFSVCVWAADPLPRRTWLRALPGLKMRGIAFGSPKSHGDFWPFSPGNGPGVLLARPLTNQQKFFKEHSKRKWDELHLDRHTQRHTSYNHNHTHIHQQISS